MTRSLSSVSPPIAVMAIGVFCSGVSRLVAVTWTASRFLTLLAEGVFSVGWLACWPAAWTAADANTAVTAMYSAE